MAYDLLIVIYVLLISMCFKPNLENTKLITALKQAFHLWIQINRPNVRVQNKAKAQYKWYF